MTHYRSNETTQVRSGNLDRAVVMGTGEAERFGIYSEVTGV